MVFVIVECITMGLATVWFAIGCLVAAICAGLGFPFPVQLIAFLVVSLCLLAFTRPWAKKYLNNRLTATNADRLVGQIGIVTIPIDNLHAEGQILVNGSYWTARNAKGDEIIEKDAQVKVVELNGAKCLVELS
ncbi:MAG: NfeD family protein [Lachnospiraceae bacterium]|nr:NfeD family protein [Lachnospiraceae bacterium]